MPDLAPGARADLAQLHQTCHAHGASLVLIGATALALHFPGPSRQTNDVDFSVALDLPEFELLATALQSTGWGRAQSVEHRWHGRNGSLVDLLPAGPELRRAQFVVWPQSKQRMSLIGFDHVFAHALPMPVAPGLTLQVAPPAVLALLKIVACMENPAREKDIGDLGIILDRYEASGDRLYSNEVLDAALADIALAPAFLLGRDLARLCRPREVVAIAAFLQLMEQEAPAWWAFVRSRGTTWEERAQAQARATMQAFASGFRSIR